MHIEAKDFTRFVEKIFPLSFINKKVLDVGSGDINGNNRFLFKDCEYHGNDVYSAPNVTVVSKTSALEFPDETFDTVISTECFEHDPEYMESFKKICLMLKPGGLLVFTCASTNRPEHGTRRTTPSVSFGTIGNVEGWTDYYKNLTVDDLNESISINSVFSSSRAYYNRKSADLYFWGVKRSDKGTYLVSPYIRNKFVGKIEGQYSENFPGEYIKDGVKQTWSYP